MIDLSIFSEETPLTFGTRGDLRDGRSTLGESMPVEVYRLFEYSIKETLEKSLGKEETIKLFRHAGKLAGLQFCKNTLDVSTPFDNFLSQLKTTLREMKIGILRIESINQKEEMVITISEDLDCSGLPVIGKTVCNYDEGFLEGIFEAYTGKIYHVVEVDCWAKGDRVCRFTAKVKNLTA